MRDNKHVITAVEWIYKDRARKDMVGDKEVFLCGTLFKSSDTCFIYQYLSGQRLLVHIFLDKLEPNLE